MTDFSAVIVIGCAAIAFILCTSETLGPQRGYFSRCPGMVLSMRQWPVTVLRLSFVVQGWLVVTVPYMHFKILA